MNGFCPGKRLSKPSTWTTSEYQWYVYVRTYVCTLWIYAHCECNPVVLFNPPNFCLFTIHVHVIGKVIPSTKAGVNGGPNTLEDYLGRTLLSVLFSDTRLHVLYIRTYIRCPAPSPSVYWLFTHVCMYFSSLCQAVATHLTNPMKRSGSMVVRGQVDHRGR